MFSDPDSRVPERISIGKSNPNVMFNEITTIRQMWYRGDIGLNVTEVLIREYRYRIWRYHIGRATRQTGERLVE
jgi:hypothetical protein